MPNLWTTTTQRVYETFYGPKSRDVEYDTKYEEMKQVERGMLHMKAAFRNFHGNTVGIKNMCKDVYMCLGAAFDSQSSYGSLAKDMIEIHQEIETSYDTLVNILLIVGSKHQFDIAQY